MSQVPPRPALRPNVEAFPDVPRILLGNEEWPVPLLAPRQNRVIEPRLMPLMLGLFPQYEKLAKLRAAGEMPPPDFVAMTEAQFDAAIDIVVAALSRAHPAVRKDDVLDMPGVNSVQLVIALSTIQTATGLFAKKKPGTGEEPRPGESASPSIGTSSSPGPAATSEQTPSSGKTSSPAPE